MRAIVIVMLLVGGEAAASCLRPTCLCPGEVPEFVVDSTVTSISGASDVAHVTASLSNVDGGSGPADVTVPFRNGDAVGTRVLVFVFPNGQVLRGAVVESGQAMCSAYTFPDGGDFHIDANEAMRIMASPDCSTEEAAIAAPKPVACHDVGGPGAILGCGATSGGVALLGLALAAAFLVRGAGSRQR